MTQSKRSVLFFTLTALLALGAACGDDDAESSAGDEDGGSHTPGDHDSGTAGSGGGESDAAMPSSGIEIAGEWTSMYGDETITDTTWDNGFAAASIVSFDNDDNEAITQDPPSEDDAGVEREGSFSKIVWTEIEGDAFYYCTVSFLQPSAEEAEANAMAFDESNPDVDGCGDSGFPWTKLERK